MLFFMNFGRIYKGWVFKKFSIDGVLFGENLWKTLLILWKNKQNQGFFWKIFF